MEIVLMLFGLSHVFNSEYKWLKSPVISDYSPIISNIQVGISYVPGESDIDYENVVTGGISYNNKLFNMIDCFLSFTGEFANAGSEKELNKLSKWNAGFSMQYIRYYWFAFIWKYR